MDISKRILELREKFNISQYRLAKLSGVSQSFISSIEAGEKEPTLLTISKICDGLGISLVEFIAGDEPQKTNLPADLRQLLLEAKKLTPEQRKILIEFIRSISD